MRLDNKSDLRRLWETQDHMHLVVQLEAAEPLSFSKKRCDGKLDSVLAPARRTWSYDDCTLGINMANDRICGKSAPDLVCRYGSMYRAPWLKYGWNDSGYVSVGPTDSVGYLLVNCPATFLWQSCVFH